jgi:hypothetical protein
VSLLPSSPRGSALSVARRKVVPVSTVITLIRYTLRLYASCRRCATSDACCSLRAAKMPFSKAAVGANMGATSRAVTVSTWNWAAAAAKRSEA